VIGVVSITIAMKLTFRILKYTKLHNTNMAAIDKMTGIEFERYVVKLLKAKGYSHIRLTEEYDYGIDIIAKKDGITWGIQVKRYSKLVKASAVRQVVTALKKYDCDRAMVISNSFYSEVAKELARSNKCELVDRSILTSWAAINV
jgi:restriction system protein